jgi:hypothetical protein
MGELFTNNLPKGLKDRFSEAHYVEETPQWEEYHVTTSTYVMI